MQCSDSYQPQYITSCMPQQMEHQSTDTPLRDFKPPSLLSYNCHFLEQLQGTYKFEIGKVHVHINVLVPILENQHLYNLACTIVRRVSSDGDAMTDQIIFEEPTRFILCSLDRKVLAQMEKGYDMKNGITWKSIEKVRDLVWRRAGEVTFNFVSGNWANSSMCQMKQISSTGSVTSINSYPKKYPVVSL